MSTTVKAGWLKDSESNKFAPKTLISQVVDDDGTSLQIQLDELQHGLESIPQSDWNQNDSTKLDFVKNRPFYTTDPVETVIAEGTIPANGMLQTSASINSLTIGETYNAVFDGTTYSNLVCVNYDGLPSIGNDAFVFAIQSGRAMAYAANGSVSHTIKVTGSMSTIIPLDRKYIAEHIDTIAGEKVEGKAYTVDGEQVTAGKGAEVFNDYINNIASGQYSHAEGMNNIASGDVAHAEGWSTVASGSYSHTEGYETVASESRSHAEGWSTEATGQAAHAEGFATHATGQYSHAEGDNAIASGRASHAEGYSTDAVADYSHAEGMQTIASSEYQHVQGKFNVEDITDTYAHIVGNGTSNSSRKNIHTVDWQGNGWFAGDIYVGGSGQDDANAVKVCTEADSIVYSDESDEYTSTVPLNADTLGGVPAADYATHSFVTNKIAEAQLDGADNIDLSGYATKDDLNALTYSDVGAAPSGYGYGEAPVSLGSTADDTVFVQKLTEQFNKIAGKSKLVALTHGGGAFIGTLWNAGNNYGTLVASSYAEPNVGYRYKQMVRVCTNGTWGSWVDFSPTSFMGNSGNQTLSGSFTISDPSNAGRNFTMSRTISSKEYKLAMQPTDSVGNLYYYQNGTLANAMQLYPDRTSFKKPVAITAGGTGAITADAALKNLGGMSMTLLWENASPTSAFDAQTVSLALSDYSQVLVYFRVYSGSGTYSEETFGVHGLVGNWCMATSNSETGSSPSQRAFQITNTGIKFSLAYYATSIGGSLSWSSNLLIPTKIYGIKGVS